MLFVRIEPHFNHYSSKLFIFYNGPLFVCTLTSWQCGVTTWNIQTYEFSIRSRPYTNNTTDANYEKVRII